MTASVFSGGLSKRVIGAAVEALRAGELIIYPTDTIYGIGCDLKNLKALGILNKLKNRPRHKPFSFICNSLSEAAKYADITDAAYRLMRKFLPGPYTFVLPKGEGIPKKMASADHAVGIRIPDHQVPLTIVSEFGSPITTTSVNVSTDEPLCAIGDLSPEFRAAVAVIIDGGPLENTASTVIDFSGELPHVIREGKGYEEIGPYLS